MVMVTEVVEHLAADWQLAGLTSGSMVLLHSDIRRTLRRLRQMGAPLDPALVLQSFLLAIGPEGTLLLPLFNFDFTQGIPFDLRTTPSRMGTLTELGRSWPGAVRTGHPIYSFCVLGAQQDLFRGLDNFSAYGPDSPFAILHQQKGHVAILDLSDHDSITFGHYVEESIGVPYRYHKRFTGLYTDATGQTEERTYGMYVRDIEAGVVTLGNPVGEIFWEKGLYHGDRPGHGCGLRVIEAVHFYDQVAAILQSGQTRGITFDLV